MGDEEDGGSKKNPLIIAAESLARSSATHAGWLQKLSSSGRWSKRYFLLLPGAGTSRFLVYYRSANPEAPILASMDVSQAGDPALAPDNSSEFSIFWDKQRRFRAGSPEEAARWVACIAAAQARKARGGARPAAGYQAGGDAFSPSDKAPTWGERRPPADSRECCCAVA
jgi:hypothetical protein